MTWDKLDSRVLRVASDDDDDEVCWSSLYTRSHNLRISASRPFHSGIILIAASSFGSLVFGLLHCHSTQQLTASSYTTDTEVDKSPRLYLSVTTFHQRVVIFHN